MKSLDAKLISSASNIFYLTKLTDFSVDEREAFIIIFKNKRYLITDQRYSEAVKKKTNGFEILDSGAIDFITSGAKDFFKKNNIKNLGFEDRDITVWEFNQLKKQIKLVPMDMSKNRVIKNNTEILNIKKACKITDEAFEYILTKLRTDITEIQISEELISFFKLKNSIPSFKPIVAFGPSSSAPHHESTNSKLKKNQIVLLDFGVRINGYCSDMTRTVFFGNSTDEFKKIYNTVLGAQTIAINKVKTEIKASTIDKSARDYILKNGFPNIIHAVGHGIGVDVHEAPTLSPNSNELIKNGMVFSIEPGIYILGYGGVRIEDLVLVRDGKSELISKAKRGIINVNVK